ncbi:MAG: helix-hairpin-helix domain-containing protein [Myxococcota bacterium]|nr:helix-hairpin-helix domain-containing protein [Myxococcota bacterium]
MTCTTHRLRAWALALASVALFAVSAPAAEMDPTLTGVVNVNTASSEELQLLPGIGETRARALVALRKRRGGFKTLEELKEVKGIGAAGLERMRPFLRLQGRTTAARP